MVQEPVPGFEKAEIDLLRIALKHSHKARFPVEQCFKFAGVAEIDQVKVPFLHINHLIANKKAINRPKDRSDVIEPERIKKMLEEDAAGGQKL